MMSLYPSSGGRDEFQARLDVCSLFWEKSHVRLQSRFWRYDRAIWLGRKAKTLRPAKASVRRESCTGDFSRGHPVKDNYDRTINLRSFDHLTSMGIGALSGGSKICFYSHCKHLRQPGSQTLVFNRKTTAWKIARKIMTNPKPPMYPTWIPSIAGCRKRKIAKDMNIRQVYSFVFSSKKDPHRIEEKHGRPF